MKSTSFTAADVDIPIKVLHDSELVESISENKFIFLRHLQLCPTNRCNLNCKFCSCGDREKKLELSFDEIKSILDASKAAGCLALTVTGGGEPLLHKDINEVISYSYSIGINVGLVTNGVFLKNLKETPSWCRISFDSDRTFSDIEQSVTEAVTLHPSTDWAFSYVLHNGVGDIRKVVKFANAHDFTHVRVVCDIFAPNEDMLRDARRELEGIDQKVIYQPRSQPSHGSKKCWVSLLRPTIGADGHVYPCCGAQYAVKDSSKNFNSTMSMGKNIEDIIVNQKKFDGSVCDVCYYGGYNKVLGLLMSEVEHREWI